MAKIMEMDKVGLQQWLEGRPQKIRDMVNKYPPDRLYRMDTGHRIFIRAYCEDGTVRVIVSGKFNALAFEREVFGVDPMTLVECELPDESEPVGSRLTDKKDIMEYIKSVAEKRR